MLQDEDYDSDTSDEDFVPPEGVESEDEPVLEKDDESDEAEDEDEGAVTKKDKKRKKSRKGKRKGSSLFEKLNKNHTGEEKEEQVVNEQDKKKDDDIWADFLADVEDKPSPPPKPKSSSWAALLGNKKPSTSDTNISEIQATTSKDVIKKDDVSKRNTVKITQIYEFAGEEVRVEKELDASSAEAKAALASPEPNTNEGKGSSPGVGGLKRPGGLSSIVGLLDSKKQKLTTLEKTKLDWNNFKTEEGLDEDLERHKKSKHGYLDKQAFLERADLRQFEIERSMRMNKRSNR